MSENKIEKTIGNLLREARLSKNISIEDASKRTKIHPNILKAMENDDFKFSGTVYAKGFLKLYAEFLGLDKEDLVRRFQGVSGMSDEQPAVRKVPYSSRYLKPSINALRKINFKIVVIVILILVAGIGLIRLIRHRKTAPARAVSVALQKTEMKKSSVAQESAKKPVFITPAQAVSKEEEKIILVVRAKVKTWLQVKVDGKVFFQSVLAKGAAETWEAKEKIELWLGNAGGVQLELNGRLLEKIGRPGQTLRHVVVTKAGLSIQK